MITGRPRARHTHRRTPTHTRMQLPPRRPAAHLHVGPLDQLTVRVDRAIHDAATMRVPGHAGRYVRVDTDQWTWEIDYRQGHR